MSVHLIGSDVPSGSIRIFVVTPEDLEALSNRLEERDRNWIAASEFTAKADEVCLLNGDDGKLSGVIFGAPKADMQRRDFEYSKLLAKLPSGTYHFDEVPQNETLVLLGLLLQAYRFSRYKPTNQNKEHIFVASDEAVIEEVSRMAYAISFTRDLINTPTNDLGPEQLVNAVKDLAVQYGAQVEEIIGDELLTQNFPLVHAVGRASESASRLVDMRWGEEDAPKVTLVGKGVCFDTGGLNIKTGNFMTLMKKDMGGAANVLGLAQMIMDAGLPVRLRVIIPAVENAIAGNAFRPGDVLPSRAGLRVEISNTDAEGRLILADALAYADEESPEMLIDMATLTGAARVAVGPELSPFYTNDELFADELSVRAKDMSDPVWRMPLWQPYQSMLDSSVADVNHASSGGFAGSVTAALFLSRFVRNAESWAHFDIYGWSPSSKPARPKGGEAQAIRAIYGLLSARYGV